MLQQKYHGFWWRATVICGICGQIKNKVKMKKLNVWRTAKLTAKLTDFWIKRKVNSVNITSYTCILLHKTFRQTLLFTGIAQHVLKKAQSWYDLTRGWIHKANICRASTYQNFMRHLHCAVLDIGKHEKNTSLFVSNHYSVDTLM